MKKNRLTPIQIITIALIVVYLIWEKNVQQWIADHPEDSDLALRADLMVILPILAVFIGISIWQYFQGE